MPPLPEHTDSVALLRSYSKIQVSTKVGPCLTNALFENCPQSGRDDTLANDVKDEPMNGSSQDSESEDAQEIAESEAATRGRLQNAQFEDL